MLHMLQRQSLWSSYFNTRRIQQFLNRTYASQAASSARWKARQTKDKFGREAKLQGLKGRAAFKLLQIDEKHKLFRKGDTVVDLGYAPGSWSQVAFSRTSPGGRVVGVDVIPAQPPAGVSTIQGDFLSPSVQAEVRAYVKDPQRGRPWHRPTNLVSHLHALSAHQQNTERVLTADTASDEAQPVSSTTSSNVPSDLSIAQAHTPPQSSPSFLRVNEDSGRGVQSDEVEERVVDVVLSDMSAPWVQPSTTWKRSFSDPYYRMMNASGLKSKDHIDSMQLCAAALSFAFDTLKVGGHFVCKYYAGDEEKQFEKRLRQVFDKVYREKPEASRKESKESFFVALRRNFSTPRDVVFGDQRPVV